MNNENTPVINEVTINGVVYVPAYGNLSAESNAKLPYCIVRSQLSGIVAGYLQKRSDNAVVMFKARRIWGWSNLWSLSKIAVHGIDESGECKCSATVSKTILTMVDEIMFCSDVCEKSILAAPDYQGSTSDNQTDVPDSKDDTSDYLNNSTTNSAIHARD